MAVEVDQRLRDIQREYLDFLDDEEDQGIYQQKVRDMITNTEIRLVVNVNDLRRKNPDRCKQLLESSFEELLCFNRALREFVASIDPLYSKQHEEFYVGFEGSFGNKHVTPRSLTSKFLGNLVCVEGIVTKCSLIHPKVVRSVHYCPATKKTMERRYTDMTSLDAKPSSGIYPTKDDDGNLLETEYGLCVYKDHQSFSIQEMPEKAPPGQLPRSVDIVADGDLVDRCKPGDRVQLIGTFRCLPAKKNSFTSCTFRTILIANNISLMSKEISPVFSVDDISKIRNFAKQKKDVFEILGRSVAPSIHGHEYIKKAVLCMLLGGNEKVLANGTRLRGDINVLLIGDPSVAKSQMLRYVLFTAPRAIPTTGRGSSGVGLTAAVTTDQESGDRRLEAGAMVLADRGIVCIDEFDKMSDIDRTAIHEVMEQGRVTISKAGIHAKLNARCSVLAAANPVYGRYDQYKTPMENIGLQDSLLSRFDLLFIVLDKMDPECDRQIADHVLRMHRYRGSGEQDGDVLPMGSNSTVLATQDPDVEEREQTETPVYEKYDHMLHGNSRKKSERIVSMQFMRKYIHVAKALTPTLTRPASELIAEEYTKIRSQDSLQQDNLARTQPVTARSLETMIRLATAHAKCRLSKTVEREDAECAVELVQFAYFKKVLTKEKRRKRGSAEDSSDEDEEGGESQKGDKEGSSPPKKRQRREKSKRSRRQTVAEGEDGYDPYDFSKSETEGEEDPEPLEESRKKRKASDGSSAPGTPAPSTPAASSAPAASQALSEDRMKSFRASLYNLFQKERAQSVQLDQVTTHVNSEHKAEPFTEEEIMSAISAMMDENQVMLSDKIVFLI
ncbi:zygotic DNA replication licensing factor mcm3-like [Littorina saxatilis]|uniref:DNA replication licensing factor MCM3 n=1 Tax=Littorina saxatilis TaxID=31220 RepID=A0AAN9G234_9CAEN